MDQLSRRSFLRILVATGGAAAIITTSGCTNSSASSSYAASSSAAASASASASVEEGARLASLAVISDSHIAVDNELTQERLAGALQDISEFERPVDGILAIGDLTDDGRIPEYDLFKSILNESPCSIDDLVVACGNHEYYANEGSELEDFFALNDRFVEEWGIPGIYYDTYKAGIHFIILGNDDPDEDNWGVFYFSEQQFSWLESLLRADYEKGVTSFVLCHEPIPDTVEGSLDGQWGHDNSLRGSNADRLLALLTKFPGTVLLTGHTHGWPNATDTVSGTQTLFVTDGSVGRSYRNVWPSNQREFISVGVRMDVYADHLEIWPRCFTDKTWDEPISMNLLRPPR